MAEVFGVNLPDINFWSGTSGMTVTIIAAILAFGIVGVVVVYFLSQWKVYNKKIVVFENIAGQGYRLAYKDRARLVKLGDGGEEILYLKKKKVYRSAYGKKMGKNTYWFAIGQDGYWYNIILGDVDAKMGMLDIEPIDRDMRYMHVAIRKNISDRYKKQGFMDKYGSYIMNATFLIIMMIGIALLLNQMSKIGSSLGGAVEAAKQVQEATKNIVASLDNICGGSGIKPA